MGHLLTLLQKKKIIVQDGFNRADSAVSMGNANTGQAWSPLSGTWGIINNQAYELNGISVSKFTTVDAGNENGKVTADVFIFAGTEIGIILRTIDASNCIVAYLRSTGLNFIKIVAGAQTALGSFSFTPVEGQKYTISAILAGSSIRVFLDGIQRASVTELSFLTEKNMDCISLGQQRLIVSITLWWRDYENNGTQNRFRHTRRPNQTRHSCYMVASH